MTVKNLVLTLVAGALALASDSALPFDTGFSKLRDSMNVNNLQFLKEEEGISPPALAFNPTGDLLATRSIYQKINIWDWKTNSKIHSLEIPKDANDSSTVTPIQFSPDGSKFVACYGPSPQKRVMTIWDTSSWAVEHEMIDPDYGSGSTVCRFTPDGKYLVRALKRFQERPGDTLIVYDTKTWKPVIGARTNPLFILDFSISPDSKEIALLGIIAPTTEEEKNYNNREYAHLGSLQSTRVIIISTHSLHVKNNFEISQSPYTSARIAWAPSGKIISYATGQDLVGMNPVDGSQIYHAASKWQSSRSSLIYSRDNQDLIFAYASPEARIQVWDQNHSTSKFDVKIENNGVLAVPTNGKYLAASVNGGVKIWPLK